MYQSQSITKIVILILKLFWKSSLNHDLCNTDPVARLGNCKEKWWLRPLGFHTKGVKKYMNEQFMNSYLLPAYSQDFSLIFVTGYVLKTISLCKILCKWKHFKHTQLREFHNNHISHIKSSTAIESTLTILLLIVFTGFALPPPCTVRSHF